MRSFLCVNVNYNILYFVINYPKISQIIMTNVNPSNKWVRSMLTESDWIYYVKILKEIIDSYMHGENIKNFMDGQFAATYIKIVVK